MWHMQLTYVVSLRLLCAQAKSPFGDEPIHTGSLVMRSSKRELWSSMGGFNPHECTQVGGGEEEGGVASRE